MTLDCRERQSEAERERETASCVMRLLGNAARHIYNYFFTFKNVCFVLLKMF